MVTKRRSSVARETSTAYGSRDDSPALSREISAGEFKARCLALMDKVRDGGVEYVISKRGTPVAKLVAVNQDPRPLLGSMKGTVTVLGDIVGPLDEAWEALEADDDER
jgi:prevent-host-death family protein